MADADYIKARHKLIPAALKITSEALGIGLAAIRDVAAAVVNR